MMISVIFIVVFVQVLLVRSEFETEAYAKKFNKVNYCIRDCSDLRSGSPSGVYMIKPEGAGKFKVYCDMTTDGGGWTVFQRRLDGSTDFFRGWAHYKNGFGKLRREFWLGNDKLYALTSQGTYHLRIDLEDFENKTRYALYNTFVVRDPNDGYKLSIGGYSGNAGNALGVHNGYKFITKDRDDGHRCAALYKGGWWYSGCHYANLNGQYFEGTATYGKGIIWYHWKGFSYSMKRTTMMMKRVIYRKKKVVSG